MKRILSILMLLIVTSGIVCASGDFVVGEYSRPAGTGTRQWYYLVIQNNTDQTLDFSAAVKVYNSDGNIVGARDSSEGPVSPGERAMLTYLFDEAFETAEHTLNAKGSRYSGVSQDLSYESFSAKNKEIIEVTYNGANVARFVEVYVLFFDGDVVVSHDSTYFVDDDSELKPGKSITKELDCYEDYDSFMVILTGRAK